MVNINCTVYTTVWLVADVRFFDFSRELVELFGRQTTVIVVVESLDKMKSTVLGKLEFTLQYPDRSLKTDEFFASVQQQQTAELKV